MAGIRPGAPTERGQASLVSMRSDCGIVVSKVYARFGKDVLDGKVTSQASHTSQFYAFPYTIWKNPKLKRLLLMLCHVNKWDVTVIMQVVLGTVKWICGIEVPSGSRRNFVAAQSFVSEHKDKDSCRLPFRGLGKYQWVKSIQR